MVAVFVVDCLLRSVIAADFNVESVPPLASGGLCVEEYVEVETRRASVKTSRMVRRWVRVQYGHAVHKQ